MVARSRIKLPVTIFCSAESLPGLWRLVEGDRPSQSDWQGGLVLLHVFGGTARAMRMAFTGTGGS